MNEIEEDSKSDSLIKKHPVTSFFILTYVIGFGILIPLFLFGIGILGYIAASSATISALIIVSITEGKEGLKDLLGGFKKWRCNPLWYILAIGIPPAIILLAMGISALLGNPFPIPEPTLWLIFIPMFLLITLQAGLGEEIGWRGYANPKLSENQSALKSSLIVGIGWAAWHTPLYFIPGMIQYEMAQQIGYFQLFLIYTIYIVAAAIVHAWIYYVSDGNLWLPVLLHGSTNAFAWIFAYTNLEAYGGPTMMYIFVIIWIITAIAVTLIYGPQKLSRSKEDN